MHCFCSFVCFLAIGCELGSNIISDVFPAGCYLWVESVDVPPNVRGLMGYNKFPRQPENWNYSSQRGRVLFFHSNCADKHEVTEQ